MSLRWAHSHFVDFVMSRLNYELFLITIKYDDCRSICMHLYPNRAFFESIFIFDTLIAFAYSFDDEHNLMFVTNSAQFAETGLLCSLHSHLTNQNDFTPDTVFVSC